MYKFYLLGIQPKSMDYILRFVEKYSTSSKKEKSFRSINGSVIVNIKFEKVKNGSSVEEAVCYIQDESLFR